MERTLRRCAWLLLVAGFLGFMGLSWDVQWHADVGPDSFFTIPHGLIYASSALEGCIGLFVGIAFTLYVRRNPDTRIEHRSFLGLKGPVGFILCGLSAAVFIGSGFYDLWWHTVYGFDVTLVSPSHFGLFFSSVIGKIGVLYIFASASIRARSDQHSRLMLRNDIGFALAMASLFLSLSPFLMIALGQLRMIGVLIGYPLFAAAFFTTGLVAVSAFTKRPGMATCAAAYLSLAKLAAYASTPGMVAWLAKQENFIYRHDALVVPLISISLPLWIAAMGVWIDLWRLGERFVSRSVWLAAAWGGLAAVLLFLLDSRWTVYYRSTHKGVVKPSVAAEFVHGWWPTLGITAVIGVICAVIGLKLGESFVYANSNVRMATSGRAHSKPFVAGCALVVMLGLAAVNSVPVYAHEGAAEDGLAQVRRLEAGKYGIAVWANEYPIRARKSLQVRIVPDGGIEGLKGSYKLTLPGSSQREIKGNLYPYPGVNGAWVVELAGIPAKGHWVWEFTIQGASGTGKATLDHFEVLDPPGIPMWVGWIFGLFPLYGLIGFLIAEMLRIRKLKRLEREGRAPGYAME